MMKWFYRWLGSKINQANSVEEAEHSGLVIGSNRATKKSLRAVSVRESDELGSDPITFRMFKANGGWAIEFRQYDNRNDRVDMNLYVVNDEQELGKHISQIITMEALKR